MLVKEQSTKVKLARIHENQGLQNKTGNDGIFRYIFRKSEK